MPGDRPAELSALQRVAAGGVEDALLRAHGLPAQAVAGAQQDHVGVREGVGLLQLVLRRDAHVREGDVRVLDDLHRGLVLDLGGLVAGGVGLHDEALDLVVLLVPGPHDRDAGHGAVADPPLGPVDHPLVPLSAGRGGHAAGDVGAVLRLGQREAAGVLHRVQARQPRLLLLLRAQGLQGGPDEVVVQGEVHAEGDVRAGQLGHQVPAEQRVLGHAADVVVAQLPDAAGDLVRELVPAPGLRHVRGDDLGQGGADLRELLLLLGRQEAVVLEDVDVDQRAGAGIRGGHEGLLEVVRGGC